MQKYIWTIIAIAAALTETFVSKGFNADSFKKNTFESYAGSGGTSTCDIGSHGKGTKA